MRQTAAADLPQEAAQLLLVRFRSADVLRDEAPPRVVLCADIVRPMETTGMGLAPTEYETVNWWDLRGRNVPTGPLHLTRRPNDGCPTLTVSDYGFSWILDGPVWLFLSMYDITFDATTILGAVYTADGEGEPRPFEPISDGLPEHASRLSLEELGLSTPLLHCLESEGITTAADLCGRTAEDLLEIRDLGQQRLQEVRDRMAAVGLRLWGEEPRQ